MSEQKSAPGSPPRFRDRFFSPPVLVTVSAVAIGIVLAPWLVEQLPDLEGLPEYRVPISQVQLEPPPGQEVPANFLEEVRQAGQLPPELSVLDPELPRELAIAFGRHPWVRKVLRVQNQYPSSITVELEYRRPVAIVRIGEGGYPVDADGVLLPPADFSVQTVQNYVTVRGIAQPPRSSAGQRWSDSGVTAAASLADNLQPDWRRLGLAEIIVNSPGGDTSEPDPLLEISTTGGSRIVWGRSPLTSHPGELTVSQKIGRLKKYYDEFGSFERPFGPYEIDIRHWQEISRRSIVDPTTNTARHPSTSSRR